MGNLNGLGQKLRKSVRYHKDLDEHSGHNACLVIRDLRLHRVYPQLASPSLRYFKGNIGYPCLAIAHLPLRTPKHLEWFLHLPSLNSVVAYDRSIRSLHLRHSNLEIPCDDNLRKGRLDYEGCEMISLFMYRTHIASLFSSGCSAVITVCFHVLFPIKRLQCRNYSVLPYLVSACCTRISSLH